VVNGCENKSPVKSESENSDSLITDFINQIVISDTALNKFSLVEEPIKSIESLWLTQRDTVFWHHFGDTLTVTKKDSIEIINQTYDTAFKWTDKRFPLKSISVKLILDYRNRLFKDTTEKGFEIAKEEFETLFGKKGFISVSKPIFFRDGKYALMSYQYIDYYNFCCGFGQFILYRKENNKWFKSKVISSSIS
jgi:hypothetical protein